MAAGAVTPRSPPIAHIVNNSPTAKLAAKAATMISGRVVRSILNFPQMTDQKQAEMPEAVICRTPSAPPGRRSEHKTARGFVPEVAGPSLLWSRNSNIICGGEEKARTMTFR
jgi:hypothetical protein